MRYMDQRTFEYGVATIAKLHLTQGESIESLAFTAWSGYERSIIDDKVVQDWIEVTKEAIELVNKTEKGFAKEFFHHFQFYVENFDSTGNKRKKRLLGGLFFSNSPQNPNRKNDCMVRLKKYLVGILCGAVPLAPGQVRQEKQQTDKIVRKEAQSRKEQEYLEALERMRRS
jgi:hypothetical protein